MTDMTELTTTLAEIRSHRPCESGFAKIRDHLGVSAAEAKTHDEPFPIALLLETNGLNDALWVTAHVAPEAITRFLLRRVNSALNSLRTLRGDHSREVEAVETVASLLRRKLAGENVRDELCDAADAAVDAAAYAAAYTAASSAARAAADAAAYAAAYTAYTAYAVSSAAYAARAAAYAASPAASPASDTAADAADAARADSRDDLIAALKGDLT